MNEKVSFVINLEGTAYRGVLQLDSAVKNIVDSVNDAQDGFKRIGNFDSRKKSPKINLGPKPKYEQRMLFLSTISVSKYTTKNERTLKLATKKFSSRHIRIKRATPPHSILSYRLLISTEVEFSENGGIRKEEAKANGGV